ncbi:MAG: TetR/AcrR family transcriptional regulator [Phenylobacterium sp.]|jgi:AcrR family transcriptional regulator|uniref:TetR/AcrR family transcriptional regulator n=1 Tax=Phenylobacterium sp. TaxID=1871053 RepID=UPI002A2AD910|nr:TetR/AcrR family transcriptional regulator [Phenylobacterium sp.]MDD3836824.1 TetR/AcrR family transcriptional regulator [Phenylobacterium sp.]MDX9996331.1 TetR/AcrR family transcriptional regulator [Phenylobacterium sp.]
MAKAGALGEVKRRRLRRGRRLAPEARRGLLLDVAAARLLEQGVLPLPVQELADAAKVSKALVYRYFPEPPDLYNALLARDLGRLAKDGISAALERDPLEAAVADAAEAYYRHVAAHGPLAQLILRDRFMRGRVSGSAARLRDRLVGKLARRLRHELGLSIREAVATIGVGLTMPEECGRLAFQGELDVERGALVCRELSLGVLDVARRRAAEARR